LIPVFDKFILSANPMMRVNV